MRDDVQQWAEITRNFPRADAKINPRLENRGLMVYIVCDDETKANLRDNEHKTELILR